MGGSTVESDSGDALTAVYGRYSSPDNHERDLEYLILLITQAQET